MEHQLQKIFKWVEQKSRVDNVLVLMHPDFSGSIVDAWHLENVLFSFANLMDVTKKDVNTFDLEKWLSV